MNRNFNRIRFEDVKKAIENKGHFVMTANRVYDESAFLTAKCIIVTDNQNFTTMHPKYANEIILTCAQFEPMIEVFNESIGNERLAADRQRRYMNDEGYYEDCSDDTDAENMYLHLHDVDMNPVEDAAFANMESERLHEAMKKLTETQRRRVYLYYFKQYTYREIAEMEHTAEMSIHDSISSALKKFRKFLKKTPLQNAF